MSTVTMYIDGIANDVPSNMTIIESATQSNIRIPSLCWLPDQEIKADCRICVVEIEGRSGLHPACATRVTQGMRVLTNSPAVIQARKTNLELILARHPMDCQHCARNSGNKPSNLSDEFCGYCVFCDCVQDGECELQSLASEYDVGLGNFEWIDRDLGLDCSTAAIIKDHNKCIVCRRCVGSCSETQGIYAWSIKNRSSDSYIAAASANECLSGTNCVQCGQCVKDCPTGALSTRQEYMEVIAPVDDRSTTVVAYIDPSFMAEFSALSLFCDMSLTEVNLAAGLRRAGIDVVLSTTGIQKQIATELKDEISERRESPLIYAPCFSARSYLQKEYPALVGNLSQQKSIHVHYAEDAAKHMAPARKAVYTVLLTSAISQKAEAEQARAINLVLTPIEVKRLFNKRGVDMNLLPPTPLDNAIDGTVALLQNERGLSVSKLEIAGRKVSAVFAQGLQQVDEQLKQIMTGESHHHFVQIAAVPGESMNITNAM